MRIDYSIYPLGDRYTETRWGSWPVLLEDCKDTARSIPPHSFQRGYNLNHLDLFQILIFATPRGSPYTLMILGIGIDILSLSRFQAVVSRRGISKVAKRVCSPRELINFHNLGLNDTSAPSTRSTTTRGRETAKDISGIDKVLVEKQIRYLSSRWTLKEAAYKALYPSLPLIRTLHPDFLLSFHSFELEYHKGVPNLRLLNHSSHSHSQSEFSTSFSSLSLRLSGSEMEMEPDHGHKSREKVRGIQLMCSLSHDAGVVVGVVIATKVEDGLSTT